MARESSGFATKRKEGAQALQCTGGRLGELYTIEAEHLEITQSLGNPSRLTGEARQESIAGGGS